MAFTEVFKTASPIRGGYPVAAMAGGTWGTTGTTLTTVSSTLTSCMFVMLTEYGANVSGRMAVVTAVSGGMFDIATGVAVSGSWLAFGY